MKRSFLSVDLSVLAGLTVAAAIALSVVTAVPSAESPERPIRSSETRTTTTATTMLTPLTSAEPLREVYPLTGIAISDESEVANRRAIAVKVDGYGGVPAVWGLENADIVIEELVEGGLTRYIGVFHSSSADRVGPVRSVRSSDFAILSHLNTPVLAFSGGNAGNLRQAHTEPVRPLPPAADAGDQLYVRDRSLKAPHNLFTSTNAIWAAVEAGSPPESVFRYSQAGTFEGAAPASSVSVSMSASADVRFDYDAGSGTYRRFLEGVAQQDGTGASLSTDNVVVLETPYGVSPNDPRSPEAIPLGAGAAAVLTSGTVQRGGWLREARDRTWTLFDASMHSLLLRPGRTWVLLVPEGQPWSHQ